MYRIVFRYTTNATKGTTCKMYVNGKRVGKAQGGGYDLKGTCLGDWLYTTYRAKLTTFFNKHTTNEYNDSIGGYYGFVEPHNSKTFYLDGACGFDSMQKIAEEILGICITFVYEAKNVAIYVGKPKTGEKEL